MIPDANLKVFENNCLAIPFPSDLRTHVLIMSTASVLQICNGVAVTRLLNASLVLPRFLFNSVWRDSRFYSEHSSWCGLLGGARDEDIS